MLTLAVFVLALAVAALVVILAPWAVNEYDKFIEREADGTTEETD